MKKRQPDAKHLNMVIGFPIFHSRSAVLHDPVYRKLKINAEILPFSHPDIKKLVECVRTLKISLTAVTMPFKKSVIPFLDSVDRVARAVGAVNTIINKNGKLRGYNTDIYGMRYSPPPVLL